MMSSCVTWCYWLDQHISFISPYLWKSPFYHFFCSFTTFFCSFTIIFSAFPSPIFLGLSLSCFFLIENFCLCVFPFPCDCYWALDCLSATTTWINLLQNLLSDRMKETGSLERILIIMMWIRGYETIDYKNQFHVFHLLVDNHGCTVFERETRDTKVRYCNVGNIAICVNHESLFKITNVMIAL